MKNYNKLIPLYNMFNVDWLIGTSCNYKCSYCWETLHEGEYPFVDIDLAKKFVHKLTNKHPDKHFIFILSGGEPTLWKDLPDFLKVLRDCNAEINLITNGSKSIDWWHKYGGLIDLAVISVHWEFANLDHIENVCKVLRQNYNTCVKINILVKEEKFEESYKLAERLSSNIPGIVVDLRPIRLNHGMYLIEYKDEHLAKLKEKSRFGNFHFKHKWQEVFTDTGERFEPHLSIIKKENSWKGWKCYIGMESLKVFYDGTILRGNCDAGGPIGNINGDITLPDEPIICDKELCSCVTDMRTRKEKI